MSLALLPGCPSPPPGNQDLGGPDLLTQPDLRGQPDLATSATCTDSVKNGNESDVDCGGGTCGTCALGKACRQGTDCGSGICANGICVECASAADCVGQDTECHVRTCTNNACGVNNIAAGTRIQAQNAGDCQVNQCDGQGNIITVADNNDVRVDNNPCTQDLCVSGAPSNPPLPQGTSCGGTLVCNNQGVCVGCNTAADCPGSDTECRQRTCTNNQCGVNNTTAGTRTTAQTPGNCQVNQCDGQGNITSVADDNDLPIDGNACTDDLCQAGRPSNPALPAGTSCGTGLLCNASGVCGQCNTASDCPGQDTACQARTCVNNTCGVNNVSAGTAIAAQTTGDCRQVQCNGQGGTMSAIDNSDIPNDNNPCTNDLCTTGTPSNPPLPQGTSCGGSLVCNNQGTCVGCNTAADCPGSDTECHQRTCVNNQCGVNNTSAGTRTTAQTPGDCRINECDGQGNIVPVADDNDLPNDNNACTQDLCTAGAPSNPALPVGTSCGSGVLCDGGGRCVQCVMATNCPGQDTECQQRTCVSNTCGVNNTTAGTRTSVQNTGDCRVNQCDGQGNSVSVADNSDLPVDNNLCTQDLCTSGTPSNPPSPPRTTCGSGLICNGSGVCGQCIMAADCPGSDTECQQRTCVSNQCGVNNATAGTRTTAQTTGDCRVSQCDGNGAIVSVADNNDLPDDSNPCTADQCTSGTPSNPALPAGTACGIGQMCNGAGLCGECMVASNCPGQDTACQTRTCNNFTCGINYQPAGTRTPMQTAGDCHANQCDGAGAIVNVVDDTDVRNDNNACTQDVCTNGTPSNPPSPVGTVCGAGLVCDGSGACGECVVAADCPGQDTACRTRTCVSNRCGVNNTPAGTPTSMQTPGDCHQNQCDGTGNIVAAIDNTDVLVDNNDCTSDLCTNGTPSNPPLASGTTCSTGVCNGASACVQCVTASNCPGQDSDCRVRSCTNNTCGFSNLPSGTRIATQTPGDCQASVCDGSGGVSSVPDNTDVLVDGNQCTQDLCNAGVPSNPNQPAGTACNQGGGRYCNAAGTCSPVFSVVRVGTGAAALGTSATAVFIETHLLDGTLVGTPIAMPTAASGSNFPFTITGGASGTNGITEGSLRRSVDGRYLTLAGYGVVPGTTNPATASAATAPRVIARIDASGNINTTTRLLTAFNSSNIRTAVTADGTAFWASGISGNTTGGAWYQTLGVTTAGIQLFTNPNNNHFLGIFGGQLYGDTNTSVAPSYYSVFTIGTGLPTTTGQTVSTLPGLPTTPGTVAPDPWDFVLLDRSPTIAGFDTLYIADNRAIASGGGIQRWTYNGTTWSLSATFSNIPTPRPFINLMAIESASNVTLIAVTVESTTTNPNRIVMFVDDGTATSTLAGTVISTAGTNMSYRGVALTP